MQGERDMTTSNLDPRLPQVTVIGTGTMGSAMAARLLGAGMNVAVWSRHPASTESSVVLGATAYGEAADAVAEADIVITMLPTLDTIKAVMFDAKTVDAMRPNATWAQMGTIGVGATAQLASDAALRRPDVVFVDAPVSGSKEPAEAGQLLVLASGPREKAVMLGSVFDALGKRTMWLGPAGAGSAMKLVLNTWLAFQTEGAAESAALAESLGIDPGYLRDALSDSPLASSYALAKLQRMLDEDFHADFALDWALKDLDLVAYDADLEVAPVAAAIADRWRDLVRSGSGGLDVSAARRGLGGHASRIKS
jgi:3-hydroxyisobutyrate dehydrogenase